jgi:hypothetical protein
VQDYEAGKAIPNQAVRSHHSPVLLTLQQALPSRLAAQPRTCCLHCGACLTPRCCGAQIISKMERILGVPLRPKKK